MKNSDHLSLGLTFDDILLLPGYADFKRKDVDLSTRLTQNITLTLPIVSSPMDTVTEEKMAIAMAKNGGLGIIHRNLKIDTQLKMVKKVKKIKATSPKMTADKKKRLMVGTAVGVGDDFIERVKALEKAEVDLIVIDSGHGFTKFIIEAIQWIKKNTSLEVMAGNVATFEGAKALIKAGAEILRVGMGPGSICTTRVVTGMGVPQITAIQEAVKAAKGSKTTVVADGGVRQIGDIAKALAFGAQAVMLGSLLSGFDESPGEIIVIGEKKFKEYRGMGSIKSMKKGGAERYGQNKNLTDKKLIAEGVEALVPYKGKVNDFLYQVEGGLRASFYYIGGKNLTQFQKKVKFIRITESSLRESHPHTVKIINAGESYLLEK